MANREMLATVRPINDRLTLTADVIKMVTAAIVPHFPGRRIHRQLSFINCLPTDNYLANPQIVLNWTFLLKKVIHYEQ